jgi:hypothetical protein
MQRTYIPIPKPGKRKRAKVVFRDGRKIIRDKVEWDAERKLVRDREKGRCQDCKRMAPLHDVYDDEGDIIEVAGHAHHRKSRAIRNDSADALDWLCWRCHGKRHIPLKVCPKKVR